MVIPRKISALLAAIVAGLFLTVTAAGAAVNSGVPEYDKLMQTELDSLMDQVAGQFESTGNYLEKSEFYSVFEQGRQGQGTIRQALEDALEAQKQAEADKENPELQELARIALDDLFLAIFYQVQLNKAMATVDQEITQALIDILEGRGEGFSEEPGPFTLEFNRLGDTDPLPDPDPDPDPEGDFLYYGKAYDLDTVTAGNNGILYFTNEPFKLVVTLPEIQEPDYPDYPDECDGDECSNDDIILRADGPDWEENLPSAVFTYPAAAMPFLFYELPRPDYENDGIIDYLLQVAETDSFVISFVREGTEIRSNDFEDIEDFFDELFEGSRPESLALEYIPEAVFETPDVLKTEGFYRYTWDTLLEEDSEEKIIAEQREPEKIPPFTATLYKNSNIISYVYSADLTDEAPPHMAFVGLTPGSGQDGQPGAGLPRGIVARMAEMYGFMDEGFGPLYFGDLGKPLNLSKEYGVPFFDTEEDYMDYLIQIGSEAPSNLQDYITIIDEEGYKILFCDDPEEGEAPGLGTAYLTIGEVFISLGEMQRQELVAITQEEWEEDGVGFDLEEKFVVFMPDSTEGFTQPDEGIGNQYTVHTGNPLMVVDRSRHNYNDGLSSLDQAINHLGDNDVDLKDFLAFEEEYGDFRPEGYSDDVWDYNYEEYDAYPWWDRYTGGDSSANVNGLQARIFSDLWPNTVYKLHQSNFLAYAVQVEEDIVNEKILEMTSRADWQDIRNGIRDYDSIRERDAFFERSADAKAGRVMKDIHGNWVRVQQYILRPDNDTVEILNVSLREAGSDLSGMSTIRFTTNFEGDISNYPVRYLPWGDYLNTQYDGAYKYIEHNGIAVVDDMSVAFTNPGSESVTETREFLGFEGGTSGGVQYVANETLTLAGNLDNRSYTNTFTFGEGRTNNYEYMSHFVGGDQSGYWDVAVGTDGSAALDDDDRLQIGENMLLSVNLHMITDDPGMVGPDGYPTQWEYKAPWYVGDIWAVLGAGESPDNLFVPEDFSIEIAMYKEGVFEKPVDTIFIPMSHMDWRDLPN